MAAIPIPISRYRRKQPLQKKLMIPADAFTVQG